MRLFSFGRFASSSEDKENGEPPSIFAPQYSDDVWLEGRVKYLLNLSLGEDNFSVLVLALNGQIMRRLATQPPLVKRARDSLSQLADAISRNGAVPDVVLCCAKGLFFRRAADILMCSQIKQPFPDSSIVLMACALSELAIAHMNAVFAVLPGEYRSLAALEMLEANTIISINLPMYGSQSDINDLINGRLDDSAWQALGLEGTVVSGLFENLKRTPCRLHDDLMDRCSNELWGMQKSSDFLRRASWIVHFEPLVRPALDKWFSNITTAVPASAADKTLTIFDLKVFLAMVGSWGAAPQIVPDPLFPATIAQIHPLTKEQSEHWRALVQMVVVDGSRDLLVESKVNTVIEIVRLKRPVTGRRLVYSIFKFLAEQEGAEYGVWTEAYANRLIELIMGVDIPYHRNSTSLFPRMESDLSVDEEEAIHEHVSIYLSTVECQRGDFQQAASRLLEFDSLRSKKALLTVYEQWMSRVANPVQRKELETSLKNLKAEIEELEPSRELMKSPVSSKASGDKASPSLNSLEVALNALQSPSPRRISTGTNMGRDAQTTMNTSVLDESFQSAISGTTDASFVSACSGEEKTPQGTPVAFRVPNSSIFASPRTAHLNDSLRSGFSVGSTGSTGSNMLSVSQSQQPIVPEVADINMLAHIEEFQKKLKIQCAENEKKMKKNQDESNAFLAKLEQGLKNRPKAVPRAKTVQAKQATSVQQPQPPVSSNFDQKMREFEAKMAGSQGAQLQQPVQQVHAHKPVSSSNASFGSFNDANALLQQAANLGGFPKSSIFGSDIQHQAMSVHPSVAGNANPLLRSPSQHAVLQSTPSFGGLAAGSPSANPVFPPSPLVAQPNRNIQPTSQLGTTPKSTTVTPFQFGGTVTPQGTVPQGNQAVGVRSPPTPQQIAEMAKAQMRMNFISSGQLQSSQSPTNNGLGAAFTAMQKQNSASALQGMQQMCAHPEARGKWCPGCLSDEDQDKVLRILDALTIKWDKED